MTAKEKLLNLIHGLNDEKTIGELYVFVSTYMGCDNRNEKRLSPAGEV